MNRNLVNIVLILFLIFTNCSGDSGGSSNTTLDPTPNFNPVPSDDLAELIENTFLDNGVNIEVDPLFLDFNKNYGEIDKDDELLIRFTLNNNSGETREFNFQIFSVSTGFSILDETKQNLGGFSAISVAHGESKDFYVKFNAWLFGTQTSYLTITADVEGYINFPFRALVTGAADFKVIPTGYFCNDPEAPTIETLDFLKVSTGTNKIHTIKFCNSGGENIKINQATISNFSTPLISQAMTGNSFEDFLWQVNDEVNSTFAFGTQPSSTESFIQPNFQPYPGAVANPAGDYAVSVHHSGESIEDLILEAGKILTLDVDFVPSLGQEAPEGVLYEPESLNALLKIDTSIGTIEIPLLGASSGVEPVLQMSYRLNDSETWRPVDLSSQSPAIYFGKVSLFKDWVSNNSSLAEIKIENIGTGTKNLKFFGGSLNGFFEYYWQGDVLSFPIELQSQEAKSFEIRYLPSPTSPLDEDFEKSWDFGQFYFDHTAGNGPNSKVTLVGEQNEGFAVELFLGGSALEHEYDPGQFKNLCVFTTDAANPTVKTFRVVNNNREDQMQVNWNVSNLDSHLSVAGNSSGSLTVEPNSEGLFSVEFYTNEDSVGVPIGGTLNVSTSFPDKETQFASMLTDTIERNFEVPFQATGSGTGTSALCGGGVLGENGTVEATFIMDRVVMDLTSLVEPTRNPPAFKYHLPFELNVQEGTIRISKPTPFIWDKSDPAFSPVKQIRSYVHQATNVQGCAPLPTNPYKLEFQKGSWTGKGIECAADGDGTLSFSNPMNEEESTTILNSDTACLDNDGGEEYIDNNGVRWVVFYHDFVKFDDCNVEYYGRIATIAFRPDTEEIFNVFETAEASPNESESFYEQVYGTYQHKSYISFFEKTECGNLSADPGTTIEDPDLLKAWYECFANSADNTTRDQGFIDECSYFNFSIDAGIQPDNFDINNPDPDNWEGFGIYEPHVDETGKLHTTKYDITIYNAHMKAMVIGAGDRVKFFGHPGHLVYSDIYANITTKRMASEAALEDGSWKESLAVNTRPHFDRNQVLLEDQNPIDIGDFWTEDEVSLSFSNSIDPYSLEPGVSRGGVGRGNFRYYGNRSDAIIHSGWPINYDENNLAVLVAHGAFTGKGNTAPSFAKADAATGKGKALYFTFHGCFVAGEPTENQGCYDYRRDTGVFPETEDLLIDAYAEAGVLPDGYPSNPVDCTLLEDPSFADRNSYLYMACTNFLVTDTDRDRMTNYYDRSGRVFVNEDLYTSTSCGQGM